MSAENNLGKNKAILFTDNAFKVVCQIISGSILTYIVGINCWPPSRQPLPATVGARLVRVWHRNQPLTPPQQQRQLEP